MSLKCLLKSFVLLFLLLLVSGCGTAFSIKDRIYTDEPMYPYRATHQDCRFIYEFFFSQRAHTDSIVFGSIVSPLLIADFPISIATDTVAFPYDAYFLFEPRGQLHEAIREHSLEKAEGLLKDGADPNAVFERYTPLIVACRLGDKESALLLIKYKAEVNKDGLYGESVLSSVCSRGDSEMLKLLLRHGLDMRNKSYEDSLQEACAGWNSNKKLVKLLLDNQPDAERYRHDPSLFFTQDMEIIKLLIEYGADLNSDTWGVGTPLMNVIDRGRYSSGTVDILALLIKNGADANQLSGDRTALDAAMIYNSPKVVVDFLKAKGAKTAEELEAEKEKKKK